MFELKIKDVLERLFGIPAVKVDREDDICADWGVDARERKLFEAELYREFPKCCESFRDCQTIADFARMVSP